ncbi:MAG: SDR family NAD(P)-dependent oxidoreductase, partial [Nitrososphaerales archaeon]
MSGGRLEGNVTLITGAGSGIGRAVATLFAKEGASVAVIDIVEAGGRETEQMVRKDGGKAMFLKCDVTKYSEVKSMVSTIVDAFGKIDILHNNVGGWQREQKDTVVNDTETEWDRLMNLNLRGTFLVSKEVIP